LSEYKGFVADPSKGVVVEWIREIVTEKYDCEAGVPIVWQQNQVDPSTMDQSDLSARTINPTVQGKAGSMSRFAVLNDYLYAVLPSEMIVYHMASCDNVAQVGRFSMFTQSGMAEMITSMNDLLLVGGSAGVDIYSTQTPETPQYISSFAHVQACDPVAAQGGYAYVTLRNGEDQPCGESFSNQLDVLDISAPQYPTLLRTFNMHNPHGVAIDGNLLFIADGSEGLKVFDATKPEEVGSHQIAQFKDYFGYDVIPYNGVLVMVGEDGISQYSYSDPKNIQLLSAIPVESAK
ncbi:MAG: hypothetical protein EAZ89_09595, partial [Bacteroidetes bacterium]